MLTFAVAVLALVAGGAFAMAWAALGWVEILRDECARNRDAIRELERTHGVILMDHDDRIGAIRRDMAPWNLQRN